MQARVRVQRARWDTKKMQKKMPEHPQQKLRMFRHVPLTLRPTDGSVGLERNRKNGFLNIREKKSKKTYYGKKKLLTVGELTLYQ
jgi:hypothetical protein